MIELPLFCVDESDGILSILLTCLLTVVRRFEWILVVNSNFWFSIFPHSLFSACSVEESYGTALTSLPAVTPKLCCYTSHLLGIHQMGKIIFQYTRKNKGCWKQVIWAQANLSWLLGGCWPERWRWFLCKSRLFIWWWKFGQPSPWSQPFIPHPITSHSMKTGNLRTF